MFSRILSFIRDRWHPLRKLRRLSAFGCFQNTFDFTIYKRVPGIRLRMAMKLVRDASWIAIALEPEVRAAFSLVLDVIEPRVFWDIGANLGFYSWVVRQHSSVQQVVLFEPDPTNFELIYLLFDTEKSLAGQMIFPGRRKRTVCLPIIKHASEIAPG
jgi:hypothetical protein